jgi:Zn ribbon nucleic-acid-binding protein
MPAVHRKIARKPRQTCPQCKHTKVLKTVRHADEQPRKNYCVECGHEWWEFDRNPAMTSELVPSLRGNGGCHDDTSP